MLAFQTHRIDLHELYRELLLGTCGVLTLIAHADAAEKAGGNALIREGLADQAAARDILGPVWGPIREVLDSTPMLPSLEEFAAVDQAIQGCGKHMVAMWQFLRVSACLTNDDQLYVSVS
ncbi:hypothetical protein ACFVU3_28955 [Streptomyces sp. NPDC058052]|uniref:hypothetical protein n=1 Tax=Streptomyces sp. NPDC058052 TaxID=3346316 RepID=UPI0036E1557F